MSIDKFYSRRYNKDSYNCAHFVAEVWEHLTGVDISTSIAGFLLPPKDRYVRLKIRKSFKRITLPKSPCILIMHRPKSTPHAGLYYNGKVFQIHEKGVEYQPLDVACRGFSKVRFYQC